MPIGWPTVDGGCSTSVGLRRCGDVVPMLCGGELPSNKSKQGTVGCLLNRDAIIPQAKRMFAPPAVKGIAHFHALRSAGYRTAMYLREGRCAMVTCV